MTTIGEYRPSFEEFDPKRILYRGINALYPDTFAVPRRSQPSPEMFLANFYALLEKLSQISGKLLPLRRRRRNWKSEWDEKVQRFNNVQRKLSSKMEELHQRLENFISESLDIEKIYSETDAKNYYSRLYSPRGLSYWPCFYQGSSTWSAS